MQRDVLFRGTRDGLLIVLGDVPDFERLLASLDEKLTATGGFFRGAEVTAAILGSRRLTPENHARLVQVLEGQHGMILREVKEGEQAAALLAPQGRSEAEGRGAAAVGAAPERSQGPGPEATWAIPKTREESPLVLVRTLRSGQAIYHRGDVVIMGDVNPGAEVVATGHIVVMGALRGVAHAGAAGDETAIVTALRLQPTQLRIGSRVGRAPDEVERFTPETPEIARIVDGQIVIEGRR